MNKIGLKKQKNFQKNKCNKIKILIEQENLKQAFQYKIKMKKSVNSNKIL